MTPSEMRDLDVAVAEALGWEWRRSSVTGCRALYAPGKAPVWMQAKANGDEPLTHDWADLMEQAHPHVPAYSSGRDPALLQAMEELGICCSPLVTDVDTITDWRAASGTDDAPYSPWEYGPTLAIAVCRAIVAAHKRREGR